MNLYKLTWNNSEVRALKLVADGALDEAVVGAGVRLRGFGDDQFVEVLVTSGFIRIWNDLHVTFLLDHTKLFGAKVNDVFDLKEKIK